MKKKTLFEKENEVYATKGGYILVGADLVCNNLKRVSEINNIK